MIHFIFLTNVVQQQKKSNLKISISITFFIVLCILLLNTHHLLQYFSFDYKFQKKGSQFVLGLKFFSNQMTRALHACHPSTFLRQQQRHSSNVFISFFLVCFCLSSHDMIDDFSRDFVHIHKQSNPKEIHTLTKEGSEKAGCNRGLLFEYISYIPLYQYRSNELHKVSFNQRKYKVGTRYKYLSNFCKSYPVQKETVDVCRDPIKEISMEDARGRHCFQFSERMDAKMPQGESNEDYMQAPRNNNNDDCKESRTTGFEHSTMQYQYIHTTTSMMLGGLYYCTSLHACQSRD